MDNHSVIESNKYIILLLGIFLLLSNKGHTHTEYDTNAL